MVYVLVLGSIWIHLVRVSWVPKGPWGPWAQGAHRRQACNRPAGGPAGGGRTACQTAGERQARQRQVSKKWSIFVVLCSICVYWGSWWNAVGAQMDLRGYIEERRWNADSEVSTKQLPISCDLIIRSRPQCCQICRRSCAKSPNERFHDAAGRNLRLVLYFSGPRLPNIFSG